MKRTTWDNPNKMHFESGYKLFDKQTNVISYGNVFANTQTSYFIRPHMEVECNGKEFRPGELLKADLRMLFGEYLRGYKDIPFIMRREIEDVNRDKMLILYKFRVWKRGEERVIGWVLTDEDYNLVDYKAANYYRDSSYWKRYYAVMEAARHVCNDNI